VLDEPLRDALEADVAVGLGRLATCGLPPSYLARIVEVLVDGERAQPNLRSEELEVAAGDDPVAAVLGALADSGDADTAAGLLASADLWPQLLGRTWTVGLGRLERLIALASDGELADLTVRVLLQAVGAVTDVVVTQVSTGSPEAFTLMSLSPVIGTLVGEHLRAVTETVAVGLGVDGVPARPLTTDERRLLAGLGMVTLDPAARSTVLRALVQATADAPPAVGSGAQPVAAYVHGGVFAAIAFGEAQEIRQRLYSAVAVAENRELCWDVVTAPLGWINLRRVRRVFEVASTSTAFYGPGGVPLEDFLRQPATGHDQAAFSAVVASMPGLVANELLPDPGSALDHGLGSRAGARYEVALVGQEREIWDDIVRGAEVGFLHVGGALGIVPGSDAAPR
jgi:hypothetical protein